MNSLLEPNSLDTEILELEAKIQELKQELAMLKASEHNTESQIWPIIKKEDDEQQKFDMYNTKYDSIDPNIKKFLDLPFTATFFTGLISSLKD